MGPGLVEAFETSGLSHEAYLTGQCASVFVKMMVDDALPKRVFSSLNSSKRMPGSTASATWLTWG
jgi:hypothetical protein